MVQILEIKGSYSLLLVIFLISSLFFIFKRLQSFNTSRLPPGPTPWPIVGNIPQMGKNIHITLTNFAQTYGPLMSLRLGTQYMVVGSSPAAAEQILKIHDRILSARYVSPVLPYSKEALNHSSIGFTEECNENWKYLRTLCRTELFSGKALESQECLREKKIMDMVEFLKAKEGQLVNIGELAFATVYNMLSNLLLSRDLIGLEEEIADGGLRALVKENLEVVATPNLSSFFSFLSKLDIQGLRKKLMKIEHRIRAKWQPIIEEKRERGTFSIQKDFLDCLLNLGFTDDRILQLFAELFAAGADTSTSTIEWTMAELVKNPELMKKVREEIDREINQDLLKESHLKQLPYLQACVKETLRLHPPAPLLLPHRASETCQVMNYRIPKNAQILVNIWAIGRDPSIWDEPLKFRPERFLNSTLEFKGNDFEFIPFSAGRRICPGLPMASRQVPLVLASLMHFFDWSVPHGIDPLQLDMNEKLNITLQKEQPLFLVPKARK